MRCSMSGEALMAGSTCPSPRRGSTGSYQSMRIQLAACLFTGSLMGICHSCRPWYFVCCGRLQVVIPLSAQPIFYCPRTSLAAHSLSPQGLAPKGGALSCPVSFLHFPIHFHSFPFIPTIHFHFLLFISLLRAFSSLGLLCPCLQTPLRATGSIHLTCPCSRSLQTHHVYCFTVLAVHPSYYFIQSSVRYHM